MAGISRQRAHYHEALELSRQTAEGLQPLHDDLASLTPTFDGIVYFAKDRGHNNNASMATAVQPELNDAERFASYEEKVKGRRIHLSDTALGMAFQQHDPRFIRSRLNPEHHTTYTQKAVIDTHLTGGLQAAFNTSYGTFGETDKDLHTVSSIFSKHESVITDTAAAFDRLAGKVTSIGDTLELEAPATPNAFIASWDTRGSTPLALGRYGTLRNFLLDSKYTFSAQTTPYNVHIKDTGDGQDIAFLLPESSERFDRTNPRHISSFGRTAIIPTLHRFLASHDELAKSYSDINPQISFSVGLGYVEQDQYNGRTSQEYWQTANILKHHPSDRINFTEDVSKILYPNQ